MARAEPKPRRIVIAGAAGRDFHNFNMVYRDDPAYRVVAFTANQIPGIADRRYPPSLCGALYPHGISIRDETDIEELCRSEAVDEVIFAYSDVPHQAVMHLASRVLAVGCDFAVLGPKRTMLAARRPIIAVSAVRTGCGKSQVSRWLSGHLRERGLRVAAIRHPMPYGDIACQAVQRFAARADLDAAACTLEEREEYEPHIAAGSVVFAGVDYAAILERAEAEAEILVWDGGNNDFPFIAPDLHIVLVDALRPNQLATHHPGEATLRMADIVVINKADAAATADVQALAMAVTRLVPAATIVRAASPVRLDEPEAVRGRRVLVIDDGPTITHGGMPYGAGYVAAVEAHAAVVLDPRPFADPAIGAIFHQYSHIGRVLPAVGYGPDQIAALERTIAASDAEVVVSGTPVDLAAVLSIDQPVVRARYDFADAGEPTLGGLVDAFLRERRLGKTDA